MTVCTSFFFIFRDQVGITSVGMCIKGGKAYWKMETYRVGGTPHFFPHSLTLLESTQNYVISIVSTVVVWIGIS